LESVRVTVQPMPDLGREDGLYMVVFQDRGPPLRRTGEEGAAHPDADAVIEGLERELLRTREDLERAVQDLEAANEELKSSNEELLSMNEELQSANEELETSKEEVQSANQALLGANAYLENLLRSTRIATIFLDAEGHIRSFTPAATDIYNVAAADVGRSLSHFTHRLADLPPLPSLAELQAAAGPVEHEARTDDGHWFVRRTLPFRATDGSADGYVVSFIDVTRQKASEQAVREGEARYRSLFEQAAVGIKQVTLEDGRILEANQKLCDILGYTRDEILARTYADLTHPEDVVIERERLRQLAAGEIPNYAVEKRYRRKDGSYVWVRVTSSLAVADPGRPYRVSIVEDIEARKRAQDAQRETADRLQLALSAARMGDWSWDAMTDMVTMSEPAAELFGIEPGPLMTWAGMRSLMPDEDREGAATAVTQAAESRTVYEVEYRIRRPSGGDVVWVAATGRAVYAPDGSVLGMLGIVQDVTERKRIEMALAEGSERLRIAADAAALGIFEWHIREDEVLWENDRMYEIFGRTRDEGPIRNADLGDGSVEPSDLAEFERAMEAAGERGDFHLVCRIRRRDGSQPWIEIAGRLDRAPDGTPSRLVGVVADITERKLAQERQALLIRELHHRVKNTLATVQAIVGSTARSAATIDEFYDAFVGRIVSLAHTHNLLTDDLWQTAALDELLANELGPYDEDGGKRITMSGPRVELPSQAAVPIGMAIHELTTNAAKYGALSGRGQIEIAWELVEGEAGRALRFSWTESGGPPVAPPTRQGFGSRLLQRVLTTQLQADVRIDFDPAGLRFWMEVPLADTPAVPRAE
jgi:PAS domain S-box-containing protein